MSAPNTQEPSWSALGWSAYWGTADYDARVPGSPEPQLLTQRRHERLKIVAMQLGLFNSCPCDSARHIQYPRSLEASAPLAAIRGGTETRRE
jgi:hypothetical protein